MNKGSNHEAIYDYFNKASIKNKTMLFKDTILVNRITWQVTHVTFRSRCSRKNCSYNFGIVTRKHPSYSSLFSTGAS